MTNRLYYIYFILVNVLGLFTFFSPDCTSQGLQAGSLSEKSETKGLKKRGRAIPFADYERRLRQSPRWQAMNSEERQNALEKIEQARKRFLDQQQQMQKTYEDQIMKMKKPRESLMSKRRKREQFQDADVLWSRYQALPVRKRLAIERQLGLNQVIDSEQKKKFKENLGRLSYSKRRQILRQLEQTSP